jgi:hypothetical protein
MPPLPSPFFTMNRRQPIAVEHNGRFGVLGNVSASFVGTWRVQFTCTEDFAGSLTPMARGASKDLHDDNVGFATIPYRRVQLAGVASDYALVTGASVVNITTDFTILVPAAGLSIAFLVECVAGSGIVYSQPLEGLAAP